MYDVVVCTPASVSTTTRRCAVFRSIWNQRHQPRDATRRYGLTLFWKFLLGVLNWNDALSFSVQRRRGETGDVISRLAFEAAAAEINIY